MLIGGGKKRVRKVQKVSGDGQSSQHPHSHTLQFYRIPPLGNISLQEFERFAVERLKALKLFENVSLVFTRGSEEYKNKIRTELRKMGLKTFLRTMGQEENDADVDASHEERRRDNISHFILRLAYCKSEELRRWFIQQEVDLFRFRFLQESAVSIKEFLEQNDLAYAAISQEEKAKLRRRLIGATFDMGDGLFDSSDFYRVPFTEALDLVRGRKVYLRHGYAYIPSSELVSLVCACFRLELSKALARTARMFPIIEEQERLLPMLNHINEWYLGEDYGSRKTKASGEVTANMVDGLCQESFPPCMQQLNRAVRTDHHLKYNGRLQYGLFLKGVGLSLDESMRFWRSEFTKLIELEKFERQYAYSIRYNYGKEGRRKDYTPYSCMKLIMGAPPAAGDHHGCPFRFTAPDLLAQRLKGMKISSTQADSVMEMVKGNHYQLACSRCFAAVHDQPPDDMVAIDHPNQYFELSQRILHPEKESTGASLKQPRPSLRSTGTMNQGECLPSGAVTQTVEESLGR
ncbi:PREDICTED: DNA primase large subunit-like [Priapulus caudatus]|uniref:DNA primase large subunit n=1 Tax=Priapulus caudatus TaxID=37621 RepID=A0ABM1EEH7_PRICU|nr:PREDICTED: DNA primase large subunit-like [Priapulus caudatus]XP_014670598.1 PREDICTED: DNA primase large subunit-like [Priapulus caudatus]